MNDQQLQNVILIQALRLKAAGFNVKTFTCFRGDKNNILEHGVKANHNGFAFSISTPSVSLALKWCRDVKGFLCGVSPSCDGVCFIWKYGQQGKGWAASYRSYEKFATYEAAESALLDAVLSELEKDFPGADERPVTPANPE